MLNVDELGLKDYMKRARTIKRVVFNPTRDQLREAMSEYLRKGSKITKVLTSERISSTNAYNMQTPFTPLVRG